jgi:hypothetical protein
VWQLAVGSEILAWDVDVGSAELPQFPDVHLEMKSDFHLNIDYPLVIKHDNLESGQSPFIDYRWFSN